MTYDNPSPDRERDEVSGLSNLASPAPDDFAARVLRRVGIAADVYDLYAEVETAAGGLYVAGSPAAVTGAALVTPELPRAAFEIAHRRRTGRSAIRGRPPRGVLTALRTGRTSHLALEFAGLSRDAQAVLAAVRTVPLRQLRPLSWVAREAGLPPAADHGVVRAILARNPIAVLIPTYRVTEEDGTPCDVGYPPVAGQALRQAEGTDVAEVAGLVAAGTRFLGSDTTRIYCHPTCSDARRITLAHRVPFGSSGEARRAGYRECRRCRPVAA